MNNEKRAKRIQELNVAIIAAEEALDKASFVIEAEALKAEIDRLNQEYQKLMWEE